jgi:hypothetical protein
MAEAEAKADGLLRLPTAWTPEFGLVTSPILATDGPELARVVDDLAARFAGRPVIVRSSASAESLADRGRFESIPLAEAEPASLAAALRRLRAQGEAAGVGTCGTTPSSRPSRSVQGQGDMRSR